jgi:hypothetical protein
MEVAITEPHFHGLHGGQNSTPQFMTIYTYSLEEFYNMDWQDEYKVVHHATRKRVDRLAAEHDIIRDYRRQMDRGNLVKLNLVKTYEDARGVMFSVLFTYRINLFKRQWRKVRELLRLHQMPRQM